MDRVVALSLRRPARWLALATVGAFGGALLGALAWAWSAAGSFANLWLTPDQQGARLVAHGRWEEAARRFQDPMWQGVALYRAGRFEESAAAFGRLGTPDAAFDRGNALLMRGKYDDAIASYDRALARRPDWREAQANRELAEARKAKLAPPADDAGGTGGQVAPDQVVFDAGAERSADPGQTETVAGGPLDDEQVQALWLRRVQTKPADFLRAKFAYQLSRRAAGEPAP